MRKSPASLANVVVSKRGLGQILFQLSKLGSVEANNLYVRTASNWGLHPGRRYATMKITPQEEALLKALHLPKGAILNGHPSGWRVVYRSPKNRKLEVTVHTRSKPPKRRTFVIGGSRRRLVAVSAKRVTPTKEAVTMATRTRRKAKPVEEDELDELEGLEDLDDLEDLEDEEEPEDEDEEDEDEEEEEPAPKRRSRAKKAPAKKASSTTRKRKTTVEDEDDEDEEDEEDEEPPARKRKATTAKGSSKAKSGTAKKSPAKGGNLPATRELPKGQVGPQGIAELVGGDCDARYVRIWLRGSDYERDDGSRWAFSKTEARTIAKEIRQARKRAGA